MYVWKLIFSTDTVVGFEQDMYTFVGSEVVQVCALLLDNPPATAVSLTSVELSTSK